MSVHDGREPRGGPHQPHLEIPWHAENQRAVRPRPGAGQAEITGRFHGNHKSSRATAGRLCLEGMQRIHAFIMPIPGPPAKGAGTPVHPVRLRRLTERLLTVWSGGRAGRGA
ncbi:hypothetical protein NicSoilB8_20750 [Arthrobacter sp. NicSoilB8]|nr:hypothetical protein NicSoilB8_20750 [Arthrobacter sp. NicSoilB8]